MILLSENRFDAVGWRGIGSYTGRVNFRGQDMFAATTTECREQASALFRGWYRSADEGVLPERVHIVGISALGYADPPWMKHTRRKNYVVETGKYLSHAIEFALNNQNAVEEYTDKYRELQEVSTQISRMRGCNLGDGFCFDLDATQPKFTEGEHNLLQRTKMTMYGGIYNVPVWCLEHRSLMSFLTHIPRLFRDLTYYTHLPIKHHKWSNSEIYSNYRYIPQRLIWMNLFTTFGYSLFAMRYARQYFWTYLRILLDGVRNTSFLSLLSRNTTSNGYYSFLRSSSVWGRLSDDVKHMHRGMGDYGTTWLVRPILK